MLSAAEFFELEHTAHSKLFEKDKYVWKRSSRSQAICSFVSSRGRRAGRKPFISESVFIGSGTIVEQGAC
jgi:hypothetical protein